MVAQIPDAVAAPIWILLLPVVVLGGFAAMVALIVFAIVKNRPGIVAAIGGMSLLGLLLAAGVLSIFFAIVGWRFHANGPHSAVVEVLPQSLPAQQEVARQQAETRRRAAQMKAEIQRHVAEATAEVQRQIAKADIHELMDKFDAPRIVLPPLPGPLALPTILPGIPVTPAEPALAEASPGEAASAAGNSEEKTADIEAAAAPGDTAKPQADAPTPDAESASTNAELVETAPRPAWVDAPPMRIGEVQRDVVVTDEWATDEECDRARDIALMLKTYERIQRLIGAPYQGFLLDHKMISDNAWGDYRLHRLASVGITVDYVRREIAKDEYLEVVERSFGPMKKLYTLMEFSPTVDRELRQRWKAYQRQERFAMVGVGAGLVLGLLGCVFGLLKIDTWTKGYYTKRLFLGVPLGILGMFGLYALLVELGFDLPH